MSEWQPARIRFVHDREPIRHLVKIREVQSRKPEEAKGFIAFIPWTFQDVDTLLTRIRGVHNLTTPEEYIRMIAMSRIMLPNVKNIQASWLTVGKKTAQPYPDDQQQPLAAEIPQPDRWFCT